MSATAQIQIKTRGHTGRGRGCGYISFIVLARAKRQYPSESQGQHTGRRRGRRDIGCVVLARQVQRPRVFGKPTGRTRVNLGSGSRRDIGCFLLARQIQRPRAFGNLLVVVESISVVEVVVISAIICEQGQKSTRIECNSLLVVVESISVVRVVVVSVSVDVSAISH